jgi:hypothetical protein
MARSKTYSHSQRYLGEALAVGHRHRGVENAATVIDGTTNWQSAQIIGYGHLSQPRSFPSAVPLYRTALLKSFVANNTPQNTSL